MGDDRPPEVPHVYVAGPYTDGDNFERVRDALIAANALREIGCAPFIPHLFAFWHFLMPRPWEAWMELDLAWLERCDALLRLPGPSKGADIEVQKAGELGIPVFTSLHELAAWMDQAMDDQQTDPAGSLPGGNGVTAA